MGIIKSESAPPTLSPFSMTDIENAAKRILLRAQTQAEQLLTAAQVEGREIRDKAFAAAVVDGRKEGLAQGTKEGHQAGHAAAVAAQKDQLAKLITTLTAGVASLEESRLKLESDGTAEVVKLSIAIAERVIKRQAAIDPAVLTANLADAMKRVVHAADVRVAIHPAQKKSLQDVMPRLQLDWPNLEHVELIEDATLAPGGCRVFTTQGQVDADLGEQLGRIVAELMPAAESAGAS
jgi:flagellar assembly protein FliH